MSDTPKCWEKRGWKFMTGDVNWEDYGGTWGKNVCRQRQWVFVVMTNMEDACGREHDPAQKYLAEICYVDLDVLSQKRIAVHGVVRTFSTVPSIFTSRNCGPVLE